MRYYGLIGAGGFGREVMPLLQAQVAEELRAGHADLCFVAEGVSEGGVVNGVPMRSLDAFLGLPGERCFNIAIANSRARERIAMACEESGAEPLSIWASTANNLIANVVGRGAIFCHSSMVTANSRIGCYFHGNYYSCVTHDCSIGDFVTFAPGVQCNGNVTIEDHAYLGAGAVLRQGTAAKPLVIGRGGGGGHQGCRPRSRGGR